MSMRQIIEDAIEGLDLDYDVVFLDGWDDAIIGTTFGGDAPLRVVYNGNAILSTLMERDGMDEEGAAEYFEFNIAGLNLGEIMPIFVAIPPGRHDA